MTFWRIISLEVIPNETKLRYLNTDIHLVEKLHRNTFLLLAQQKHTLLRELVIIQENTLSRLLHGDNGEPFLLLLLRMTCYKLAAS